MAKVSSVRSSALGVSFLIGALICVHLPSVQAVSGFQQLSVEPPNTCLNRTDDQIVNATSLKECSPFCVLNGNRPCLALSYDPDSMVCSISFTYQVQACTEVTNIQTYVVSVIPEPTTTTTTTEPTTTEVLIETTSESSADNPETMEETTEALYTALPGRIRPDQVHAASPLNGGNESYLFDSRKLVLSEYACYGAGPGMEDPPVYVIIQTAQTFNLYLMRIWGTADYATELANLTITADISSSANASDFGLGPGYPIYNPIVISNETGVGSIRYMRISKTNTNIDMCIVEIEVYDSLDIVDSAQTPTTPAPFVEIDQEHGYSSRLSGYEVFISDGHMSPASAAVCYDENGGQIYVILSTTNPFHFKTIRIYGTDNYATELDTLRITAGGSGQTVDDNFFGDGPTVPTSNIVVIRNETGIQDVDYIKISKTGLNSASLCFVEVEVYADTW